MRSLWPLLLVSGVSMACIESFHGFPDSPPDMSSPTTITITTGVPAALVVFRDGTTGAWQPAAMKTPTSFEAEVHGPYMVTVVCDDTNPGGTFHSWDTWQIGRTLDDSHDQALCKRVTGTHAITGRMTQAGAVVLGASFSNSVTPGWNFAVSAVNGTYDLIASTCAGFVVQRGIVVGGDLELTTPIDVAGQGTPYQTAALTATNAAAGETLKAGVLLETGTNPQPAILYNGPAASVRFAPTAALRDTDRQTVSLRAITTTAHGTALRALRRPFRAGGDTSYTLPAALGDPQWTVGTTQAVVSWTELPVTGNLYQTLIGTVAGGAVPASAELDLSTSFVALTAPSKAVLDTDVPGFQPQWRVDVSRAYQRRLSVQRIENGTVASVMLDDTL